MIYITSFNSLNPQLMVSFDPTMLDIVSHLTSVASALGFLPVEDSPRWQMRRFLTFAILLVIGSSTLFIGAASLMRVNEITGHAPMEVLPSMSPLSKHVCHWRLSQPFSSNCQVTRSISSRNRSLWIPQAVQSRSTGIHA